MPRAREIIALSFIGMNKQVAADLQVSEIP
jgi:hypothetical protein